MSLGGGEEEATEQAKAKSEQRMQTQANTVNSESDGRRNRSAAERSDLAPERRILSGQEKEPGRT